MTRSDQHERYEELAAGHALGALEPEDEQAFLTHLHGCARCERDLAVHLSTLTHLAYAPDAAEPPASLLDGIRAGVLASGRGSSLSEVAEVVSLGAARSRRLGAGQLHRARLMIAVAAAATLVVGLGVWNVTLQSEQSQQEQWGQRMTAAVRELGVPGTDTVPLTVGNEVVAVALVRGDELSLVVDGLKVNDTSSTTYVLWGQSRFGDVRPVAAFDVTKEGLDVHEGLRLQAGVADVTRFMLTHEQGRSAPPIPSPVLATGDL